LPSDVITVERAAPRDVQPMLRLMRQLAAEHAAIDAYFRPGDEWQDSLEMMFLDRLGRREHFLGLVKPGGRVIGMITASLQTSPVFHLKPRAMIENVVVDQDYRRRGIGRALVAAALAWCNERQVAYIELMVATGNPAGQRFWQACGFEPVMLRLQRRGSEVSDGER